MVRVITQLPNYDLYESQKVARLAESVGFDGVIALENAHNPFLPLAAAALVTDKIQLGTAVAMAFHAPPRLPRTRPGTFRTRQRAASILDSAPR